MAQVLFINQPKYNFDMTVEGKNVCAGCKKEISVGFMAIKYEDKLFDSYRCLAAFKGVILDGTSLSTIMDKSALKTILKE